MAKLNIRPLGDKVIVKRVEASAMTKGGIVLPDTAKEKPKRGIVKAIGSGKLLDDGTRGEMQVRANDEVVFTSYAGTDIKVDGEEYMIMDESDILGVVS
ncbi:MAG: co-chaperone GroES [Phycisphaerales bacterium]|nr:co-chaperone GroES [Phycisphaerales bacterium]